MFEKNINITLLKINEISENNKLDVIKKYGKKAIITDLFIVLGGRLNENIYNTVNDNKKECYN